MEDEEENITIDDFFEDVIGPTEEDKELCETLARSSDLSSELEALNAVKFKKDLDAKDLYLYAHTQPQLNIDGIKMCIRDRGSTTSLSHWFWDFFFSLGGHPKLHGLVESLCRL